jgi:hypothetical protein
MHDFSNLTCPQITGTILKNPKSETISKSECSKSKTNAANYLDFKMFWEFEFMSFEFV